MAAELTAARQAAEAAEERANSAERTLVNATAQHQLASEAQAAEVAQARAEVRPRRQRAARTAASSLGRWAWAARGRGRGIAAQGAVVRA